MSVRRVVVDHVLFVVADLDASRRLCTAALAPLGYAELQVQDDCVAYGTEDLDDFAIYRGEPVTSAAHVAFDADGCEAVDAFFTAAVAHGATPPGSPGSGRSTPSGTTRRSSTTSTATTSRPYGTRRTRSSTRPATPASPEAQARG